MMVRTITMHGTLSQSLISLLSLLSAQPASSPNQHWVFDKEQIRTNASGEQPATWWQVDCTGLRHLEEGCNFSFLESTSTLRDICLSCPVLLLQHCNLRAHRMPGLSHGITGNSVLAQGAPFIARKGLIVGT